jgi:mono/diheme cytochrome c family protein
MNINKYIISSIMYTMCFLFTGCGNNQTVYDSATTTTTTSTSSSTNITATTTGGGTTTTTALVTDGATLYATDCAACHGAVASTTINTPTTLAAIQAAIASTSFGMNSIALSSLTTAQLTNIATYLNNN